ncbi:MAG: SCO family protein [Chloroflexi bacterium]|nr:SCO family protein [Chloroflexota bacterium]
MIRWLKRYWVWIVAPLALFLALSVSARFIGPPQILAPSFELTDQKGETVSLASLQGKAVALTFLYTYCPDTCPLYVGKMYRAFDKIASVQDEVAVVVVTVDPERDTPETIKSYTSRWPSGWHFLTGSPGQLQTVWGDYGIAVQKESGVSDDHGEHASYSVSHTAKVVLIDTSGFQATELKGEWQPDELAGRLQALAEGRPVPGQSLSQTAMAFLYNCGSVVFAGLGQAVTHAVTTAIILASVGLLFVVLWR